MSVLIIDVHNLVHRAAHTNKNLWSEQQDVFTGMYYGFFNMLHKYVLDFSPSMIWLVSDPNTPQEKSNWRTQYQPAYKQRDKDRDEESKKRYSAIQRQMPMLKQACGWMNCFWMEQAHLEADDIIGWLWNAYPESDCTLLSTDKDMFTLLRPGYKIYYPGQKRTLLLDHENFPQHSAEFVSGNHKREEEKKIRFHTIEEWAEFRWLDGDKSDKLPGLPSCGPVAARKIMDAGGYEQFMREVANDPKPGKTALKWVSEEGQRVYALNRYLMKINPPPPEHVQFDITNPLCQTGISDYDSLKSWMLQLNFADKENSLIARLRSNPLCLPKGSPFDPLRSY